jgi:hypothetical protein
MRMTCAALTGLLIALAGCSHVQEAGVSSPHKLKHHDGDRVLLSKTGGGLVMVWVDPAAPLSAGTGMVAARLR